MTYNKDSDIIIFLIYVDDIQVMGNNSNMIQTLIDHLISLFTLKNVRTLNYFLGIKATKVYNSYHLSQTKYIQQLFEKVRLQECKPTSMSMN